MQTFLPYSDFQKTAEVLDGKRLGKQRVETYQLLLQLCGVKMLDYPHWEPRLGGWDHPAAAMWAGHERSLLDYQKAICNEWTSRGFRDTTLEKSSLVLELIGKSSWTEEPPPWLGIEDVHRSHRSNLLRKDPDYYSKFFDESPELPYIWPTTSWDLLERKRSNFQRAKELFEDFR